MSPSHEAWIEGVALWSPSLPGWPVAREALHGAPVERANER